MKISLVLPRIFFIMKKARSWSFTNYREGREKTFRIVVNPKGKNLIRKYIKK